ncbi:MAG: FG-GAP repeat domain-containing protein [Planctomycetales bacterium]
MAIGDVDNDGDIDAFVCRPYENRLWFNDGKGQFDTVNLIQSEDDTAAVAIADLNGDGILELFAK